ncbi:GNAT family N-acetyltransferase [Paenibacillus nasutitermitis]|uniref:N-acetyltransferase YvbK n=1 Tax=Paenibacillus nasutitermitis TaxID=1652958 RepID=A0A916Z514_9BACL|nr:GNAT family N-acetyltransferase [Paenibacillus nasutitermitis]GGD77077.1 putative N-acetyltransferase YvbK [Paenibacillus nasutitermitis]
MEIRKLRPDEAPPVELLWLADPCKVFVDDYIQRGQCYVADRDGGIIGEYVLLPTRPATVELVNVAVAEREQGKGVGKLLVLDAIKQAKLLGYKTVELGTGSSGVAQLALYQKCGFRITGIDIDFFVRHYEEEIWENGIRLKDMVRLSLDV